MAFPGKPIAGSHLRPRAQTLALEPRILFDGAAATAAADQHQNADQPAGKDTTAHTSPVEAAPAPTLTPAPSAARALLVIDSRVEQRDQLLAQLPGNVTAIVVNSSEDGLAAISAALAQLGKVDSIQVISHGAAGQFTLGNRTVSSDNVDQLAGTLQQWRGNLSEGADIQLYGCDVGAGSAGNTLVSELARWTGADVGASSNATGSQDAGGDWRLETHAGDIDKSIALSAVALSDFHGLLADAAPSVTIGSGGQDVLLGDQFSFDVTFTNGSSQVGYAPYITLFLPSTGKDGDDGVNFISASYLGRTLSSSVVTFDANGNAQSPIAKDASGNFITLNAATYGLRAGDSMVVISLPFASFSADQPPITVQVTASLSNLADTSFSTGSPDLTIRAAGGFELGNDALNNPTNDPSLLQAGSAGFVVHPTVISTRETINTPEGETATGPNFGRTLTLTATPAPGQTLTNVVVTQPLPDNIQVTAITPGPGGTLTSITLHDGTVVTDPAAIAVLIAADDAFITSFTVEYSALTAATDTVVSFYVPDADADGDQVLDPTTGAPTTIVFGPPTAAGRWVPLDPRDVTAPATNIEFSGTGTGTSFIAKSITLLKQVTLQTDIGQTGITPGDTLNYTLNVAISDYFAFGKDFFGEGQLVIRDQLSDGQTLSGTPTLTVTLNGVARTIALQTSTTVNADGTTSMVFDIAESLRAGLSSIRGWLNGDLAFDNNLEGAVTAVISYGALVGQRYTPPAGAPHGEINEGDDLGNAATVEGTVLLDLFNLTGQSQSDGSSTTSTIPTNNIDISLVEVNNGAPPSNGELRPGDLVTFQLSYDLVTGDYEQFKLTAYLPLPLFNVSGITWGSGDAAGQWQLGGGNSNLGGVLSVTSAAGNAIVFDFGSFATSITSGSRIVVQFTVRVGDQPFADQRSLDVLAQSTQQTTLTDRTLVSTDVAPIVSIAEPSLAIIHGVVSGSNGTVTGTSGSWNPPGSSGAPFNGSITQLSDVDGNVSGIDGADRLRLVSALENSGGGGAFDVTTQVTLAAGLSFVNGSLANANLLIYRGDGTQLVAGIDYSVSGNQITFLDAGGQATLLAGRAGTTSDTSGANIVIISYDVQVSASIEASRTLQTTATLTNYASVNGGTDFTPVDLSDVAGQQVAAPVVVKKYAGGSLDDSDSSATHTTGSDLVVGESMLYDIVVTLPEGGTLSLRIDDLIPAGLRLNTAFNGNQGYLIILTRTGSGALAADFVGNVVVSAANGIGGTLGNDGVGARLTFASATAAADNIVGNNSFVIRLQLVASNVIGNQAGKVLQNNAQLVYSDPDGDTANGAIAVDRTVTLSGGQPIVTVREPTLQVTQAITSTIPPNGLDEGINVTFTITIRNGTSNNDFSAFDISLLDTLPTELDNVTLSGVLYQGGATNNGGVGFEIVNGVLRTATGANIDIAKGGSIVLTLTGVVNASAAMHADFISQASVQWSSLDGANPGERTGVDGLLNSGVLNDYRTTSVLVFDVAQAIILSRVGGLPDTSAPNPTTAIQETVSIGEVIRYRVVVLVPEGNNPNYRIQITLANGLEFISPDALSNALRIAFISNGGLVSDANLIVGGTLDINGNEDSPEAQPITPDLSGPAPTGIFDPSRVTVVINSNGSQTVTFDMGNVVNGNGSDSDLEGISLEFNVRVANQTSNSAGALLNVSALEIVNGNGRASSEVLVEKIVEPSFTGMDKHIITFDPNPAGTSGTATVAVDFTQNGGLPAFDTQLSDGFANGSNYSLVSITINGQSFTAANLPLGISFSTASGLQVNFDQLDVGAQVRVVYQVTLPNSVTIASTNATLTWSSLPEDFTQFGGSAVGVDGAIDGERTGSTVGPNQYILRDTAGLGVIAGTLWNDTASATTSTTPDGPGLAGQTVILTWAGADGRLDTSADNLQFSTVTDANGQYRFGVLPGGVFRIDTPAGLISYPQPLGDLRVRIDSDGLTLGQIEVTLADAASAQADAGYVEQNDAPVNTLPGNQAGSEDVPLAIGGISVADVDANRNPDPAGRTLQVTLSVQHGTLSLLNVPVGLGINGQNTARLEITGTLADINAALASLQYLGNTDFNGIDTLTVVSNDQGNFGDGDGDGTPGQNPADAKQDTDSLQIVLEAVNDTPIANDDFITALEAGGTNNNMPGINPRANLLSNDTDVDIATNGDVLHMVSVAPGLNGTAVNVPPQGVTSIQGLYGRLVVAGNGLYQYIIDNNNPQVQALRLAGQTLVEQFSYIMADKAGATASATLTVTIQGANDTPVGVDDDGVAIEAGGKFNATPGSNGAGNVLGNDTDVDSAANGEVLRVSGVRPVAEGQVGAFVTVPAGSSAMVLGLYGTLTLNSNGGYTYVLDNNNAAVQRLSAGDQLVEFFSYRVTDLGGLDDVAQLRMVIQGANDNPVASDDVAEAQAASTNGSAVESNRSGNVILFPSRPGTINQPGGNGIDQDVDAADQPSSQLLVTGVINKPEASYNPLTDVLSSVAGGTTSNNGTVVIGLYGTLTIGADGSFLYNVDSNNTTVQALPAGTTLTEVFSYEVTDTKGLTDIAQLVITVHGVNAPPVAQIVVAIATEAGGVDNLAPGVNPTGDVTVNAFDPDGDPITVVGIRTGSPNDGGSSIAVTAGGTVIVGQYGTLTLFPDGTYSYVVDNDNADVQALRRSSDLLLERFTYTISDGVGATPETDDGEIFVLIRGQNDTPVAVNDSNLAIEAGGLNNTTPGQDPSGNVLDNDRDVDGGEVPGDLPNHDYGETRAVASVSTGAGTPGTLGSELRGTYGWLTLNADGSYTYRLDNSLADVQALRVGNSLQDLFSYNVIDAAGAQASANLTIDIQGANDTPVGQNDSATAVEAGGVANTTLGSNPTGNVLANDIDVDRFGETLSVTGFRQGNVAALPGGTLQGLYGSLVLNANGNYSYVLDNSNPVVQALLTANDTLLERFTYSLRDLAGATSSAVLTITIHGSNDAPVAVDDTALAVEAGGTFNGTLGLNPSANLLANDKDVDANDSKTLTGIRTGNEAAGGTFTTVSGNLSLTGLYGTLTVGANGSYSYVVDNNLAMVQALKPGESLVETFTYRMRDRAGASDNAQLTVTVRGAWDAPVARDDIAVAVADNGMGNAVNPSRNVLDNDSDVDAGDSKHVTGIRIGAESAGPVASNVPADTDNSNGTLLNGLYGTLIIGADGSYTYFVDSTNIAVRSLTPLQFLEEHFTYQVTDNGNLNDLAQLTILIRGRNEPPVAVGDSATAVEAGGVNNGDAGVNPRGNVIDNDRDIEGDTLHVSTIRTGGLAGTGTAVVPGTVLRGLYGDLTLNADGSWSYVLDNSLPEVEALRISGQTLTDVFTYTLVDVWGASANAELVITVDGRNDTPVARDDSAVAVEAGGVANGTPGQNASGNVLLNDSDVDSIANGETRQVLSVGNESGQSALAGQTLVGRYGQLLLNADGSYTYLIDNDNPTVQALRTAGETLSESFTYLMRDTQGATAQARLTVVIQGANDNPVARDDSASVNDQTQPAQTTGNVLPNDSDVDGNEVLQVTGIRSGAESASGTTGALGQPLSGRYGTLIINADGSYTYTLDLSNPEVLAAAGLGQVLQDFFTYTLSDRNGATDQAQLVINLNISAPFIPAPGGDFFERPTDTTYIPPSLPTPQPAIFITPVIEREAQLRELSSWATDGSNLWLAQPLPQRAESLGAGLGLVPGQFVAQAVRSSRLNSEQDLAWVLGRQGRVDLNADGLLADPSLFAVDPQDMVRNPSHLEAKPEHRPAKGFSAQLRAAARQGRP
ncbi:VCBS domain-containing protein [Pseudomonas fontis]|uniref:VCBS domain-containing protein n=1 Tax=Pseudomonas fontis TaxID=2942633 RepID=A0ABT5NWD2_9PSED|nr:VCBS domain-containing protein [Pseudomonas fontis]MDD0976207.1 VCBS domain-containing protein [Pseudomonas fontis]MDD0992483.1 VCBS domain-containing protein [Pseudomonas fontis]